MDAVDLLCYCVCDVLKHNRQDELKLLEIQQRQEEEEEEQRRRMVRFVRSRVYCCRDVGIDGRMNSDGLWSVGCVYVVRGGDHATYLLLFVLFLSTAAVWQFAAA